MMQPDRTILDAETSLILPVLQAATEALNSLHFAADQAQDGVFDAEDADQVVPAEDSQEIRDQLVDMVENLFSTISHVADTYKLDLRFARVGPSRYIILDRQ